MIFIVDDDAGFRGVLGRILRDFTVYEFADAVGAMNGIDDGEPPDLIILDAMLPATNCFAMLHELQSYTDTAGIPVLIVSGIGERLDAGELREYGVIGVLDKATMRPEEVLGYAKRFSD
jgi:DNA-binding response OmpR family regulator